MAVRYGMPQFLLRSTVRWYGTPFWEWYGDGTLVRNAPKIRLKYGTLVRYGLRCEVCGMQILNVPYCHPWSPEVGTCTAIIAVQACGGTISLAITLAPQSFLNGCADACAASNLAILSAIAQAQVKYDYEWLLFNQVWLKLTTKTWWDT